MAIVDTIDWPRTLLTLSDWDNLDPDEGHHIECVEGVLVVAPKPKSRHQKVMERLASLLDQHLPPDLTALVDMDVLLSREPLTIRAPDVIVSRLALHDTNPSRYPAHEVRLAVEIVSPGSRRTDRVMKASEYAEAGIPEYWILDGDPLTLTAYTLSSGDYRLTGEFVGTAEITTCGVPIHLDLEGLTRRPGVR
jgi:Uma2 family endonuclease